MPKILVTNDDGIYSPGLRLLYNFVRDLGEVYVVAPETPKSASGLGITLHKPLRLYQIDLCGFRVYATSGTPSDTVYLAILEVMGHVDIVLSGINIGDNTSLQVILSSGTLGAAFQAALLGIPALAFSADVDNSADLVKDEKLVRVMEIVVRESTKFILEEGMPEGIDVISFNFPRCVKNDVEVKLVPAAKLKFSQKIDVRVDPKGSRYYWLFGSLLEPIEGTDTYVIYKERNIAMTPLTLDLNVLSKPVKADLEKVMRLRDRLNEALKRVKR